MVCLIRWFAKCNSFDEISTYKRDFFKIIYVYVLRFNLRNIYKKRSNVPLIIQKCTNIMYDRIYMIAVEWMALEDTISITNHIKLENTQI